MSKRKPKRELAQKPKTETRIIINQAETGTSGLQHAGGFVAEAYNHQLYWPTVAPLYNRIWRSMPEIAMVRNAFTAWGRNVDIEIDLSLIHI